MTSHNSHVRLRTEVNLRSFSFGELVATKTFKKNDFVFCEFELQQIVEMEGSRITGVSDGHFHHGSNSMNDRCFELSLRNKTISDFFKEASNQMHAIKNNALNYPDMHIYLVSKWCECCSTKDDKLIGNIYDQTHKWLESIADYVKDECKSKQIGGVKVFR